MRYKKEKIEVRNVFRLKDPEAVSVRFWQVFAKAEDVFRQMRLRKMFKINYPSKKDVASVPSSLTPRK